MTQPPEGATDRELITALAAALVAGVALAMVAKILSRFTGIGSLAGRIIDEMNWAGLIGRTAEELSIMPRNDAPATLILHQSIVRNSILRALYLVNASRRMAPALASKDFNQLQRARDVEARFLLAHEEAERKRNESARRVAEEASRFGVDRNGELLLGWRAVIDRKTSVDCRWAHGRNFNALVPPIIGYPGTVHLHCRCTPRTPWPTRKRVERGTIPTHD